jgi:NAD(P)-dependent dehydrogenase (short-subunit alcohol dehydrogenase family)
MASRYLTSEQIDKYQNLEYTFRDRTLQGRVILISGGTGGLGTALAARLLIEQAVPVVGYRSNQGRAQTVKSKLESLYGSKVHLVEGDIYNAPDRKRYIDVASRVGEAIYGFVCFAGDPARVNFDELQSEDLARSFNTNFIGPILLAKEVGEHMIANKVEGSLVMLSSMQAVGLFERSLNYASPKAALIHACRVLAKQWSGEHNLRINVVAPGATVVGMAESSVSSGKYDGYIERKGVHHFGRPEDVAKAVRFLLEPDNYITGQVITVDGGLSLKA